MSEGQKSKDRPVPWAVFAVALFVFLGGSWLLWDMKPWAAREAAAPLPTSTVKILGRDDAAAKKAEAELDGPASSSRPAHSASPAAEAAPSSSVR
jgi:hypothetical protein